MTIDDSHQQHIEETPELLEESLQAFDSQVKALFPSAILNEAKHSSDDFANPDFRKLFLRTDLYDVSLAVKRFQRYWKNRKDLFGNLKVIAPDLVTVERGYVRLTHDHDRVVTIDPTRIADSYKVDDIVQSIFFVLDHAIKRSEEAQKRGMVYLIDCSKALHPKYLDGRLIQKTAKVFNDGFPIRVTAVIIMNLHPIGQGFISIFKRLMKPAIRKRIKVLKKTKENELLEQFAGLNQEELASKVGYEPWKH